MNKTEGACFIHHFTRRTLDVGARHYDQCVRIHLTQFHQHVESVHAFHHQIEQYQPWLFEKVNFKRGHSVLRFHHLITGGFEDSSQRAARERLIIDDQNVSAHTTSMIARAIPSRATLLSLSPASTIT